MRQAESSVEVARAGLVNAMRGAKPYISDTSKLEEFKKTSLQERFEHHSIDVPRNQRRNKRQVTYLSTESKSQGNGDEQEKTLEHV